MSSRLVSGLTRGQIAQRLKSGAIVRIVRGVYATADPSPRDVVRIVMEAFPEAIVTGRTAAEIYLGQDVTFPVQVAAYHRMPSSDYVDAVRLARGYFRRLDGVKVLLPVAALAHCVDDELGRAMLEAVYRGRDGRRKFQDDAAYCGRLPQRVRGIISAAALGTDSGAEVKLVRRLQEAGVEVVTNYQIGPYFWDIVIPAWHVAVEIDSRAHHTSDTDFVRDRWKNNDAVLRGWLTLRYAGSCIANHLDVVVDQILTARDPRPVPAVWKWHWVFRRLLNHGEEYAELEW